MDTVAFAAGAASAVSVFVTAWCVTKVVIFFKNLFP